MSGLSRDHAISGKTRPASHHQFTAVSRFGRQLPGNHR